MNCRKARKLARVLSKALAKGHRLHANDPRTACLFELVREAAVSAVQMQAARAVEMQMARSGPFSPISE